MQTRSFCPFDDCGAPLAADSGFCPKCRRVYSAVGASGTWVCHFCKTVNFPAASTCATCLSAASRRAQPFKVSKGLLVAVVILLAVVAFVARPSGGSQPDAGSGVRSLTPDAAGVPWQDYDPSVKVRVDSLKSAGDCAGLQAEFDLADANNDATRARTGHNNADLMGYINDQMRAAGCFD